MLLSGLQVSHLLLGTRSHCGWEKERWLRKKNLRRLVIVKSLQSYICIPTCSFPTLGGLMCTLTESYLVCNWGIIPEHTAAKLNYRGSALACSGSGPDTAHHRGCSFWFKNTQKKLEGHWVTDTHQVLYFYNWLIHGAAMLGRCSPRRYEKAHPLCNISRRFDAKGCDCVTLVSGVGGAFNMVLKCRCKGGQISTGSNSVSVVFLGFNPSFNEKKKRAI